MVAQRVTGQQEGFAEYVGLLPAVGKPPQDKSVLVAVLLTLFFGAFGLFYTVRWWIVLLVIIAETAFAVATLGLGLLVVGPLNVVWGAIGASRQHSAFQVRLAETAAPRLLTGH